MSDSPPPFPSSRPSKKNVGKWIVYIIPFVSLIVLLLAIPFILRINADAASLNRASDGCGQATAIARALNHYAKDHNGRYPEGLSSTEVFQHLLDNSYLTDPSLFYTYPPLPHKVKAAHSPLQPENVCFDFTGGADLSSPDSLPLVFTTGFKVRYSASTSIVPYPKKWFNGNWFGYSTKGESPQCFSINESHFFPPDFDPKGKIYRQLTPNGELPP